MLLHEDSLFFSLSLSEHTLPSIASIPNNFFVKAGGIDLSFLIIILSMFLVKEEKRRSIQEKKKKRSERCCHMLSFIPCHAFKTKKAKTKSSPHICYLSHPVDISFLTQHNSLLDSVVSHYYLQPAGLQVRT